MKGRYPEKGQVTKHPAFQAGAKSQAENSELHSQRAQELMPDDMNLEEQRVWKRVVPELSAAGRLSPLYVDVIVEYCVVKVRLDGLRKDLDKREWTYATSGRNGRQLKSRPEVAQLNDDWRKWNSLVGQLGLSPATELRFNDRQGLLFVDEFGAI